MTTRYTKIGNYYVRRPQAVQVGPERVTLREIVGLTLFWLAMLGSLWVWLAIMAAGQS